MDYGSGPYTVTFPAGETRVSFNVSINNNDIYERNEDFTLIINPPIAGVTVGSPDQATVIIVDNNDGKYNIVTVLFGYEIYPTEVATLYKLLLI